MNQFSTTQRSVTTAGYDELRWTPFSNKLSPTSILRKSDVLSEAKCSLCLLWLLFAWIQLSLLKASEEKKNLIFIDLGKVNFILLTEWQEESDHYLRRSDISNTPSLKPFLPYYSPAQLSVILSITVSTDHSHWPDTAPKCLTAHTTAQRSTVCCYVM
jgi:hypothetical protein